MPFVERLNRGAFQDTVNGLQTEMGVLCLLIYFHYPFIHVTSARSVVAYIFLNLDGISA